MPAVGLGTYRVFNVEGDASIARCEVVVDAAVAAGANLIDTSPMYGRAEEVVSAAAEGRRDELFIATKVWAKTRAIGGDQIQVALDFFDYVDLYQVHNLLGFADHRPVLEGLVADGKARLIGASHYLVSAFADLAELCRAGQIHAIQVPYHPGERSIERELLPLAADLGIGVIGMMPLNQGRLLERRPSADELAPLQPYGVATWPQALLKWALSDRRIHAVIPATSRVEHMRENAAAGDPPWFGDDERRLVERLAGVT